MTGLCRCGAHHEQPPHGSLELFTIYGDVAVMLCAACTIQAVRFVTNQTTEVVMPEQVIERVIVRVEDPEAWEWDDLTVPIEEWVNEDLPAELRKEAS